MTATVVVVGSVNVDHVVRVRRLPGRGETVIGGRFESHGGGKGANQAVAAARLGARVLLVGAVGADAAGRAARGDLEAAGVDVTLLATRHAPTGVASILVDHTGENLIAVASGANARVDRALVGHAFGRIDPEHAVVLACLEIPTAAVQAAAELAHERGWPFVLNPAPARRLPVSLVGLCAALTPNESELARLGGVGALLAAGARAVVVTRGDAGADLFRPGVGVVHQAPFPAAVVDTTGAGDAFSGALAWALASGWSLERAVESAAAAGALATERAGARGGMPDADRLQGSLTAARTR